LYFTDANQNYIRLTTCIYIRNKFKRNLFDSVEVITCDQTDGRTEAEHLAILGGRRRRVVPLYRCHCSLTCMMIIQSQCCQSVSLLMAETRDSAPLIMKPTTDHVGLRWQVTFTLPQSMPIRPVLILYSKFQRVRNT